MKVTTTPFSKDGWASSTCDFTWENVETVKKLLQANNNSIWKVLICLQDHKDFEATDVQLVIFIEQVKEGKLQLPGTA